MKKQIVVAIAMSSMVAGVLTVQAHAATTSYYPTNISEQGQIISSPQHIDAYDSGYLTAFLPLFYVNQALAKYGIQGSWDGSNWNLTLPNGMNADMSNPQTGQQTSSSTLSMSINGTVMQYAPRQTDGDPSDGYQSTTYLPIWYINQVLGRLGIQSSWDGTGWSMTHVIPMTQQDMANAMWQVFDGVTWAVDAHPSMSQVGISLTNAPLTAGDVATWISQWAEQAKGTTPYFGPEQGQWVPYSLQYEASSDPYTWANINGLYQGTQINSAIGVLNAQEASQVLSNLKWWLTGDEVINGVHHLHVPFYSNYLSWYGQQQNKVSSTDYQNVLDEAIRVYDGITATVNGTGVSLALPNLTSSTYKLGWDVVDGYWEYGGWQASDNQGGKTIKIPNKGTPGLNINLATLVPNFYLEGYLVSYQNINGVPDFAEPMSVDVGQTKEGK